MTRVLHLSYGNSAGLPQAWCRAHREAGVDAYHVCETVNEFGYPVDELLRWSRDDSKDDGIAPHVDQATHIVVHDVPGYCRVAADSGKPWIYRACGTPSWLGLDSIPRDVPRLCETAEFVPHGFELLPMPIWLDDYPAHHPPSEFTVCHAPSQRYVKGTSAIITACRQAGVTLDLVEATTHADCLARKARCHVLVDMIIDHHNPRPERMVGFGVNGLEAWAIGLPVLGEQHPDVPDQPDAPFLPTSADHLADHLVELRHDPARRTRLAAAGRRYLQDQRDPARQAAADLARLGIT